MALRSFVLALCCACGHAQQTRTASAGPSACGPEIRGAESLLAPGSITLLGEVHGTDAAPRLVGDLLCHAAERAGKAGVVLALEIPRADQPWIDAAISASNASAAREALMHAAHFNAFADGRNSRAMVELVDRARSLRQAGFTIDVVAFDADSEQRVPGMTRDGTMAANLASALSVHPNWTVLVLAGNAHVSTKMGTSCAQPAPMGAKLVESYGNVRALNLAHAGGTAWTCGGRPGHTREEVMRTCGSQAVEGVALGDASFVELRDDADACGYHGRWYVGPVTASPPAAR